MHKRVRPTSGDSSSELDIPVVVPSAVHYQGLSETAVTIPPVVGPARSSSTSTTIRGATPLCNIQEARRFCAEQLPRVCKCPKAAIRCNVRVHAGMVQRRAVGLNGLSTSEKEERVCNELRGMYNGKSSINGGFDHR